VPENPKQYWLVLPGGTDMKAGREQRTAGSATLVNGPGLC
jgi:hypothetical protein